ncbi:MAG: hypothetical protein U5L00_06795 [Desulfovermiculus sp.]|nr:hypothetical protein [Desulfovermiculus sp.]
MPKNSDFFTGQEVLERWETTAFELKEHIKNRNMEFLTKDGIKKRGNGLVINLVKKDKGRGISQIDCLDSNNIPNILISKETIYAEEGHHSQTEEDYSYKKRKKVLCALLYRMQKNMGRPYPFTQAQAASHFFPGDYDLNGHSYYKEAAAKRFKRYAHEGEQELDDISEEYQLHLQSEVQKIFEKLKRS